VAEFGSDHSPLWEFASISSTACNPERAPVPDSPTEAGRLDRGCTAGHGCSRRIFDTNLRISATAPLNEIRFAGHFRVVVLSSRPSMPLLTLSECGEGTYHNQPEHMPVTVPILLPTINLAEGSYSTLPARPEV